MSQPGFAGKRHIVDIPASGGAFLPILATTVVRRCVIEESPVTSSGAPNALQGALQYQLPNDNTNPPFTDGFTTTFQADGIPTAGFTDVARIELGNPVAQHEAFGEIIGNGPNVVVGMPDGTPATTLLKIRSGAGATSVVVTEYN